MYKPSPLKLCLCSHCCSETPFLLQLFVWLWNPHSSHHGRYWRGTCLVCFADLYTRTVWPQHNSIKWRKKNLFGSGGSFVFDEKGKLWLWSCLNVRINNSVNLHKMRSESKWNWCIYPTLKTHAMTFSPLLYTTSLYPTTFKESVPPHLHDSSLYRGREVCVFQPLWWFG